MAPVSYGELAARLAGEGLVLRGGFHFGAEEDVPRRNGAAESGTLLLVGVIGGGTWQYFARSRPADADPLDAWTKRLVGAVAAEIGAVPVYPSDRPYRPFQQWAKRAEPVFESPLGLLIHPVYGLWHAYRAALSLPGHIELPQRPPQPSPCASCADRPCLAACPVGAFTGTGYDVAACAGHLAGAKGAECLSGGCRARDACPVGRNHRYPDAQIRFHMAAFERSVSGAVPG